MKRRDKAVYLVVSVIFLASCAASGAFFLVGRTSAGPEDLVLEIISENRVYRSSSLADLEGSPLELRSGGGTNVLFVEGGAVRMISADCPGGDCLRMAPLTSVRGVIVCLPHRLSIKLRRTGGKSPSDGVDAVAY